MRLQDARSVGVGRIKCEVDEESVLKGRSSSGKDESKWMAATWGSCTWTCVTAICRCLSYCVPGEGMVEEKVKSSKCTCSCTR